MNRHKLHRVFISTVYSSAIRGGETFHNTQTKLTGLSLSEERQNPGRRRVTASASSAVRQGESRGNDLFWDFTANR